MGSAVSGAAPIPATVRVVDGITVLEHGADALDRAPRLRIDSAPLASMGGTDAEFDLTHVRSVILLPDGRVATFASLGNRLLIFRPDGRGERVIGRTGGAPGEFMSPMGMIRWRADTLFLVDPGNRRLNWVHPDDGVVLLRPFEAGVFRPFSTPSGVLADGRVVVHSAGLVQEGVEDSIVRPPAPIALLDPATGTAREIAAIPDLEIAMVETRYRGRRALSREVVRLGQSAHVAVWDTLIATSSREDHSVDLRRSNGNVISRLRLVRARRPVTSRMRELQIARELRRFEGGAGERMVDPEESRRLVRSAPFADSLPPFSHLFSTTGGTLWVVDAIAPGDTVWTATAFRLDGAIVARLHVPGASRPVAFGDDRVVLLSRNDDDVVTLSVHRLRR